MPWSTIDFAEDIDNSAFMREKLLTDVANNHAPIKFALVKGVKTPSVTAQLLEAKRDRDYHFKKARLSNSTYHWRMFKKLRNFANHEERRLKSKYYCNLIDESKHDSNKMWKAITA